MRAREWRMGTLITIQSGLPFTPQLAVNSLNNGGFQLPNRVGSGALPASQQSYLRWFDTSLNAAGIARSNFRRSISTAIPDMTSFADRD